MWYKLSDDKTRIENVAPTNKILDDGTIITGTSAGSGDLTTSSVTETCGTKELTTNGSSPSTKNESITLSTLQPYITCYMWKRTA